MTSASYSCTFVHGNTMEHQLHHASSMTCPVLLSTRCDAIEMRISAYFCSKPCKFRGLKGPKSPKGTRPKNAPSCSKSLTQQFQRNFSRFLKAQAMPLSSAIHHSLRKMYQEGASNPIGTFWKILEGLQYLII